MCRTVSIARGAACVPLQPSRASAAACPNSTDSSCIGRLLLQSQPCQAARATSTRRGSATARREAMSPCVCIPAGLARLIICVCPCTHKQCRHSGVACVGQLCMFVSCRLTSLLVTVAFGNLCRGVLDDMHMQQQPVMHRLSLALQSVLHARPGTGGRQR